MTGSISVKQALMLVGKYLIRLDEVVTSDGLANMETSEMGCTGREEGWDVEPRRFNMWLTNRFPCLVPRFSNRHNRRRHLKFEKKRPRKCSPDEGRRRHSDSGYSNAWEMGYSHLCPRAGRVKFEPSVARNATPSSTNGSASPLSSFGVHIDTLPNSLRQCNSCCA